MTATTKTETSPVIRAHYAITVLLKSWESHNADYRAKAADANASLSSFTIEGLMQAGGREEATRILIRVRDTLSSYLTYDAEDTNRVFPSGVEEEEEALGYLTKATENMIDRYMDWYKPNSSSNAHVEIELYKHESYKDAIKALQGRAF